MKNHSSDTVLSDTKLSSEEACKLVFDNLNSSFVLVGKDFRVLTTSELTKQRINERLGVEVNEHTTIFDLFPDKYHNEIATIFEAVLKGEKKILEVSLPKDGNIYYFENHFNPARNSSNKIVGVLVSSQDVTTIKKSNLILKEVEERWRCALEGGNQGVWDWNMQTGEVFYSDSYKRLYGFDTSELEGKIEEWENLIHPEDREKMKRAVAEHMSSPDPYYESTYRIRAKDGNYKWVLARGMIIERNEKGKPLRMIGTHTDITKQVATEQTYKMLFYSNPLPMWTYDLATLRFLTVNDAAIHDYGYSEKEFLSMSIKDIRPADDIPWLMEVIKTRGRQGHLKGTTRHIKKNGEIIFVEVSTHKLEEPDNNAVLVVAHDITSKIKAEEEMRKSNERFVLASRATSDAIYDWDLLANELHWGGGMQTLFGFEPTEVPVSLWEDLVHPDDRDRVHNSIYVALQDPETEFWKAEYRFIKADGHFSYVFDRGFIIRDQNKKAVRMIGSMQDITDRKLLEEELLQNELEKQKAINQATVDSQEQERTEIGKELHDNVNQILTTTKLYLDLAISNRELKDELIEKSNRNIMRVINEIRQLSRSLMDPTIGDLGLIESINDLVENINLTKKLQVKLEADKRLDVFLDKNHKLTVFRIIQEALNNTIKYAKASTVAVRLKLYKNDAEISITDNGIGFDPSSVRMGAGLKNIQNRVYLINGTYTIQTAPQQGCKIIIKFPIQK